MLTVSNQDGFSLVELLVVMAIIGVVMIPLVNVFTRSVQQLQASERRKIANRVANSCLSELRSVARYSDLPNGGTTSCDGLDSGENWYEYELPFADLDYEYRVLSDRVANDSGRNVKLVKIKVRYTSALHDGKRCLASVDCNDWDLSTFVAKR